MSKLPDISRWKPLGERANTRYYVVEERVLAAVPRIGSVDTESTARANMAFQHAHFQETAPGVILIFFDNLVSQDKGARAVYQNEANPSLLLATALVGGNLLSRAMGSFFMGLSKPRMPVKMFGTTEEAIDWARERIAVNERESAK